MKSMYEAVAASTYPGRGIIAGRTSDAGRAFFAYFIMGRSVNSRNRVSARARASAPRRSIPLRWRIPR